MSTQSTFAWGAQSIGARLREVSIRRIGWTVASMVLALSVRVGAAGEIQLFNTKVLGQPTSSPVTLLFPRLGGEAAPYVVWTDNICGEYAAASVFYESPVTFDEVRRSLNERYGAFELPDPSVTAERRFPFSPTMALWRVTDPAVVSPSRPLLVINLTIEDESVRVIYMNAREGGCVATPPQ
jgi:hypothetical protein